MTHKQADTVSIAIYHKAVELVLNVAHDIALNGEQTHAPELLSQFY